MQKTLSEHSSNITRIDLSNKGLTAIPKEVFELQNLRVLNLNHNEILSIPPEIGKLKHLKVLILSYNKLTSLPEELGLLHEIRFLRLSHNKLSALPKEIRFLKNIRKLYLEGNIFNKFPKIICQLRELRKLNLSQGKFHELPVIIGNLKKLRELDLSEGNLVDIPPSISQLIHLERLNLSFNRLKKLPVELKGLVGLKYLDLGKNRLPIPPEIVRNKYYPKTILDVYFKSIWGKRSPLNEVKLIFIGQGSIGKTSLVNRITKDSFSFEQSKTEGISINQWKVPDKRKYSQTENSNNSSFITVNIWDFGGQEIMHATHQFFLTKRSLYILVLDSRLSQEENRVEYWLKIIQSFGRMSPVLIVGNKTDQHPLDIDKTGLKKKYPNIIDFISTSAATGEGISRLKETIINKVNRLRYIRDLLPEAWFLIKNKLEYLGRESNFITHDKYLDLCSQHQVSDENSQRTLISFLHDLGVVLHFQDDPRLEALGILNPQWVTNGVYKILNSHTLFQNKGVLTTSMLDEILNLPEYPRGKRLFIVDMMKKFELCYDIESDKTFLVPDLLPKDEPVMDGQENALAFQYHYTVLPSSVITRFIVRMNEFIDEKVWRTGAVLKDGGNTAVVKADIEDRKVYILVSGDKHKRHDFLSKIRGQFDAIHKTISKLEMKEMVPVPNHPEAEPVDYDLLLQMDHNNVEVYPVLSGGRMIVVNVREMLNGVARDSDRQRGNTTNIYVGGDVHADTFIAGNENQATVSKSDKKPKKKKP